jgi:hypothetical protein
MAKSDSARVSIKAYLLPYLRTLGEAIGTDDLSEIVNHLITCQKLGCFGAPQPTTGQIQKPASTAPDPHDAPLDDESLADSLGDLLAA